MPSALVKPAIRARDLEGLDRRNAKERNRLRPKKRMSAWPLSYCMSWKSFNPELMNRASVPLPKKKGKGGNLVPQPKSNLATSLMQILQSALDNSWSDQEIIQRMQSKLTKVIAGNMPMDSNESKTRRVTFADPEQFPPLPSGTERRVRSQDSHPNSILRHPQQEPSSTKPNHSVGRSAVDDWSFGSNTSGTTAPQENVPGLWPGSIRLNGIRPQLSPVFLKS